MSAVTSGGEKHLQHRPLCWGTDCPAHTSYSTHSKYVINCSLQSCSFPKFLSSGKGPWPTLFWNFKGIINSYHSLTYQILSPNQDFPWPTSPYFNGHCPHYPTLFSHSTDYSLKHACLLIADVFVVCSLCTECKLQKVGSSFPGSPFLQALEWYLVCGWCLIMSR